MARAVVIGGRIERDKTAIDPTFAFRVLKAVGRDEQNLDDEVGCDVHRYLGPGAIYCDGMRTDLVAVSRDREPHRLGASLSR
jgi:hypothetical protein